MGVFFFFFIRTLNKSVRLSCKTRRTNETNIITRATHFFNNKFDCSFVPIIAACSNFSPKISGQVPTCLFIRMRTMHSEYGIVFGKRIWLPLRQDDKTFSSLCNRFRGNSTFVQGVKRIFSCRPDEEEKN